MIAFVASNHALDALVSVRGTRVDGADIERGVRAHCRELHASESTTNAAINYALRENGSTFSAIRAGRRRADNLHHREQQRSRPIPA